MRLLPTFLAVALLAGCGPRVCRDAWLGLDKAQHFAASAAIGAAGTAVARGEGAPRIGAAAAGAGIAVALGAGKETWDLHVRRTCWSWKDLLWGLLGGAAGAAAAGAAGR